MAALPNLDPSVTSHRRLKSLLAAISLSIVVFAIPAEAGDGEQPAGLPDPRQKIVMTYLDALVRQDWEAARACWRASDLARADRLAIHYADLPVKIDGDSPISRAAVDGLVKGHVKWPTPHPLTALLDSALAGRVPDDVPPSMMSIKAVAERVGAGWGWGVDYLIVKNEEAADETETWQLAKPVAIVTEACARLAEAVQVGRYVRTITSPGTKGRTPALAALDSFVADTLERLQVPDERRRVLEREKINYLFVPPDWVELLAGAPTVGVANLQLDVVVTHHPCHLHELAHILVNFWLGELPLYTLPLLQEGVAVHLGGRWGRAPDFLAHVGRFTLETGFVTLPSMLTWEGFHRQGADLTYAPAGIVAGWVLKSAGPAGLAQIYRQLSGNEDEIQALTEEEIATVLDASLGLACESEGSPSSRTVADEFATYLKSLPANPIRPTPREPDTPSQRTDVATVKNDSLVVSIRVTDTNWKVCIFNAYGGSLRGALLLLPPDGVTASSALFEEHFPDGDVPPAIAALRFSPDEAGWYDYTHDMLLAKHIASFWPDSSYRPGVSELRLTWPRDLLPWNLLEYTDALRVVSTP